MVGEGEKYKGRSGGGGRSGRSDRSHDTNKKSRGGSGSTADRKREEDPDAYRSLSFGGGRRRGGGGAGTSRSTGYGSSHRSFHSTSTVSSSNTHRAEAEDGRFFYGTRKRGDAEDSSLASYYTRESSSYSSDDTRISHQIRRLQREEDVPTFTAHIQTLNDSLEQAHNLEYIQRNSHFLFEPLEELLLTAPSQACKMAVAQTMAFIGHLLPEDDDRFIKIVTKGLEEDASNTTSNKTKVLLLLALKRAVSLDRNKVFALTMSPEVLESVHTVLENTEVLSLMVAAVEVLRTVYSIQPLVLDSIFQDLVDILVGWHIDHDQPVEVTHYVAQTLSYFPKLWQRNSNCAALLLSQFVEDMDDYLQEVKASTSPSFRLEDGADRPEVAAKKVEYFLGVYSSVLACVSPGKEEEKILDTALEPNFLHDSFAAVVAATRTLLDTGYSSHASTLFITLNKVCTSMLAHNLRKDVLELQLLAALRMQRQRLTCSTYTAQHSYLKLLTTFVEDQGNMLPPSVMTEMLCPDSPLRALRESRDASVWEAVLQLDQACLALKNVPLLLDVYQYLLADMQLCHNTLVGAEEAPEFGNTALLPGVLYTEKQAATIMQYYLTALSQLCRTRSSIITMWALKPSLLQLLSVHLTPASAVLATMYPQVQSSLVTLLHGHCRAHSHYVASSCLVVGASSSSHFLAFTPSSSSLNPSVASFEPSASSFNPAVAEFQPSWSDASSFQPPVSALPAASTTAADTSVISESVSSDFAGSTTSQNLSLILAVLEELLNLGERCSSRVLELSLEWTVEVTQCSVSSTSSSSSTDRRSELLAALQPLLLAAVRLGHCNNISQQLQLSVVQALSRIVSVVPAHQEKVHCIVVKVCMHRLSSSNEALARQYASLLSSVPLSCVARALLLSTPEVTAAPRGRSARTPNSLNEQSSRSTPWSDARDAVQQHSAEQIQRHYQLRAGCARYLPAVAFHQLISFILDSTPNQEGSDWLRSIIRMSQRLETSSKTDGIQDCTKKTSTQQQHPVVPGQDWDTRPTSGGDQGSRRQVDEEAEKDPSKKQKRLKLDEGSYVDSTSGVADPSSSSDSAEASLSKSTVGSCAPTSVVNKTDITTAHVLNSSKAAVVPSVNIPTGGVTGVSSKKCNAAAGGNDRECNDAMVAAACDESRLLTWRWLTWHVAQHCINNKLRTSLGKPQDTFMLIEVAVKLRFKQVKECAVSSKTAAAVSEGIEDHDRIADLTDSCDDSGGAMSSYPPLRVLLLLDFLDALEKNLMIASDGCASSLIPLNKGVRAFFLSNRQTCISGVARMRAAAVVVALAAAHPHAAARHATLMHITLALDSSVTEISHVAVHCARSMMAVQCPETLLGLQRDCINKFGVSLPWLTAAAYAASHRYEDALYALHQYLEGSEVLPPVLGNYNADDTVLPLPPAMSRTDFKLSSSSVFRQADPVLQEFIVEQIGNWFSALSLYDDAYYWSTTKAANDGCAYNSGALNPLQNTDYANCVKALSEFDNKVWVTMRDDLSSSKVSSSYTSGVKDWPVWRKLHFLQLTLLRYNAEAVYGNNTVLTKSELTELPAMCKREIEQLLQLSCLVQQPALQLRLTMYNQLLHQIQSHMDGSKNDVSEVITFHDGWDKSNHTLQQLPPDLLPLLTRHAKMIAQFNSQVTQECVSKLEVSCMRQARRQRNYGSCQQTLLRLLGNKSQQRQRARQYDASLIQTCVNSYTNLLSSPPVPFMPLSATLLREAAKLLYCGGAAKEGCEVLSQVVQFSEAPLLALAAADPALLGSSSNEIGQLSARSLLKIAKWINRDEEFVYSHSHGLQWTNTLLKVSLDMQGYLPPELSGLQLATLQSNIADKEQLVAQCLSLATLHSPNLAKTWYRLGSWCFKWGRTIVDRCLKSEVPLLDAGDIATVFAILAQYAGNLDNVVMEGLVATVCQALAWLPKPPQQQNQGNEQKEELSDMRLEETEGSHQYVEALVRHALSEAGLLTVDPTDQQQLLTSLKSVRHGAIQRQYVLYTIAAQSYLKFFATASGNYCKHEAPLTSAALRLVRLVVKHAAQLRPVLQHAFAELPTTPWRTIIPQLFARLNHSEGWVRESFSALLCRLAQDSPHLIVVPAVVGSNVTNDQSNTTNITDMLAKYFHRGSDKQAEEEQREADYENNDDDQIEDTAFDLMNEDMMDQSLTDNKQVMHNSFSSLVNALTKQGVEKVRDAEVLVLELRRITVLWDELWLGTLTQHQADMSRKCALLKTEIARLESNASLTQQDKKQLIKTKYEVIFKPVMLVLEQLWAISGGAAVTPHERQFQAQYGSLIQEAVHLLRNPESYFQPHHALHKISKLQQSLSENKSSRRSNSTLQMSLISPRLAELRSTSIAMPGLLGQHNQIVRIHSVSEEVSILPSKTKPKKLSFRGDDGRLYTYLFKGLEDLHLDERIMQFLSIVNTMLCTHDSDRVYRAHHYSVVPLGPRSGLIQWVDNATPLFGIYMRYQHREAQALAYKNNTPVPPVTRPSELYYQKLSPRLKAAGVSINNRKEWPKEILKAVMQELIDETPSDLLARELSACSPSVSDWWKATRTYSISSAVMSMVGFVIGLGDRHLDNLMVRLTTGEVVHIDYNICFEKGQYLRVPEPVPFRMTHNIERALGVTGVEGVFRSSCERVLSTMRQGCEVLLTLLETFLYDPLVDWTHDADAGYAGAMYGGNAALASSVREGRQQMEKGLTVTMFRVRSKEMTAPWQTNGNEVQESLQRVSQVLQEMLPQQSRMIPIQQSAAELQQHQEYLSLSKGDPSHPAHSLQQRHKELTRLQAKKAAAVEKLIQARAALAQKLQKQKVVLVTELLHRGLKTATTATVWRDTSFSSEANKLVFRSLERSLSAKSQKQHVEKLKHIETELNKVWKQVSSLLSEMCSKEMMRSVLVSRQMCRSCFELNPLHLTLAAYDAVLRDAGVDGEAVGKSSDGTASHNTRCILCPAEDGSSSNRHAVAAVSWLLQQQQHLEQWRSKVEKKISSDECGKDELMLKHRRSLAGYMKATSQFDEEAVTCTRIWVLNKMLIEIYERSETPLEGPRDYSLVTPLITHFLHETGSDWFEYREDPGLQQADQEIPWLNPRNTVRDNQEGQHITGLIAYVNKYLQVSQEAVEVAVMSAAGAATNWWHSDQAQLLQLKRRLPLTRLISVLEHLTEKQSAASQQHSDSSTPRGDTDSAESQMVEEKMRQACAIAGHIDTLISNVPQHSWLSIVNAKLKNLEPLMAVLFSRIANTPVIQSSELRCVDLGLCWEFFLESLKDETKITMYINRLRVSRVLTLLKLLDLVAPGCQEIDHGASVPAGGASTSTDGAIASVLSANICFADTAIDDLIFSANQMQALQTDLDLAAKMMACTLDKKCDADDAAKETAVAEETVSEDNIPRITVLNISEEESSASAVGFEGMFVACSAEAAMLESLDIAEDDVTSVVRVTLFKHLGVLQQQIEFMPLELMIYCLMMEDGLERLKIQATLGTVDPSSLAASVTTDCIVALEDTKTSATHSNEDEMTDGTKPREEETQSSSQSAAVKATGDVPCGSEQQTANASSPLITDDETASSPLITDDETASSSAENIKEQQAPTATEAQLSTATSISSSTLNVELAVLADVYKYYLARLQVLQFNSRVQWRQRMQQSCCTVERDLDTQLKVLLTSTGYQDTTDAPQQHQLLTAELASTEKRCLQLERLLEKLRHLHKGYFAVSSSLSKKLLEAADPNKDQTTHKFLSAEEEKNARLSAFLENSELMLDINSSICFWFSCRQQNSPVLKQEKQQHQQLLSAYQSAAAQAGDQSNKLTGCEAGIVVNQPVEKMTSKKYLELAINKVAEGLLTAQKAMEALSEEAATAASEMKRSVAQLKQLFAVHHKLITDVKDLLRALSKFKCRTGTVVREYLSLYRSYAESVTAFIKQVQNDKFRDNPQELLQQVEHFSHLTGTIYSSLLTLCDDYTEEEIDSSNNAGGSRSCSLEPNSTSSLPQQFSAYAQPASATANAENYTKLAIISSKGAGVEYNPYALSVWNRVKAKLEGRDRETDPSDPPSTVQQQVEQSIQDAKDLDNLCVLYEGWTPWV
uniref:non-specific serine/threonine protein kinase n=2 Tax=Hirondellea gigas TaxID=1518452 RepID=A0A6A7FPI8_9CRUS